MIGATPPSSICTGARRRQLREFAPHSPGKPYSSVEGRKPFAGKRRRRLREFAPHSRESLILPLRGANRLPGKGAGGRGSLRLLPGKAVFFRREAQTLHPGRAAAGCGSLRLPPGKACYEVTVEGRKPCTRKRCRRLCEFAPNSPERLILPLRGANPAPENPPGAFFEGLRRTPRRRRRRTAGCSRR